MNDIWSSSNEENFIEEKNMWHFDKYFCIFHRYDDIYPLKQNSNISLIGAGLFGAHLVNKATICYIFNN